MAGSVSRVLDGPLGPVLATASPAGLVALHHLGEGTVLPQPGTGGDNTDADGEDTTAAAHLDHLAAELDAYAAGRLRAFTVPLDLDGAGVHDQFARAVYAEIRAIPFGETAAYGEISRDAGHPRRARLVGRLCRLVPVELVVPVHRVTRADGGFVEGGTRRRRLVEHERAALRRVVGR